MSALPQVTVQVVPYAVGAHPGMLGHFVIAGFGDAPSIVYLETAAAGQIVETAGVVHQVALVWEALRSEALPRAASRDFITKIAEESTDLTGAQWRTSSYSGSNGGEPASR